MPLDSKRGGGLGVAGSFSRRGSSIPIMEKRRSSIIHSRAAQQAAKGGNGRGPSKASDRGTGPSDTGGLLDPVSFNLWDDKLKLASLTLALKVIYTPHIQ